MIGVFDSGVGGLTVVKALSQRLPQEGICYVADEAHVPYGDRSPDEIRRFALGITRFLIEQGAKIVVMGCNMSSAVALGPARQLFPDTPMVGVIEAGVRAAVRASDDCRFGVLATTGTVNTGAYTREILRLCPDAIVCEQPCPRFVPIVESGMCDSEEAESAAREYLAPLLAQRCRTIILGCTHYPFLASTIARVVTSDIIMIDPAEETATEVADILHKCGALATEKNEGWHRYFVTASPERFTTVGERFLGKAITEVEEIQWGRDLGEVEWLEKTVEQTTKSAL